MPFVALGAYKLTRDPTRFKESYTANHPLLPPPVASPFYLPIFSRLLRFAMSTSKNTMTTPRTATPTTDRHAYTFPPCSPSLISFPLRLAMSTPRTAEVVFRFGQRPPYNDFLRRGSRLFDPPHWVCHCSLRPLATTRLWLGE